MVTKSQSARGRGRLGELTTMTSTVPILFSSKSNAIFHETQTELKHFRQSVHSWTFIDLRFGLRYLLQTAHPQELTSHPVPTKF